MYHEAFWYSCLFYRATHLDHKLYTLPYDRTTSPYFQIAYPQQGETFEEWATLSHLKDSTLEVLRSNEIDDLSTVRLLNADDIKVRILLCSHIISIYQPLDPYFNNTENVDYFATIR